MTKSDAIEAAKAEVVRAARSFGGPNRGPHGSVSLAWLEGALSNLEAAIRADECAVAKVRVPDA